MKYLFLVLSLFALTSCNTRSDSRRGGYSDDRGYSNDDRGYYNDGRGYYNEDRRDRPVRDGVNETIDRSTRLLP